MILYQKQKIENAIAYFASEYKRRKGSEPTQMWLYKFLALFDFRMLKEKGTPSLGLVYHAMKMGPVPIKIYSAIQKAGRKNESRVERDKSFFLLVPSEDNSLKAFVHANGDPDLDYFTNRELDAMDAILDECIEELNLNGLIDLTHNEIRSWNIAWEKAKALGQGAREMDYADEFDNLYEKPEEDLTPEEEQFLCYRGMLKKETEPIQPC